MAFAFIENPNGNPLSDGDFLNSALEQPLSLSRTAWETAKGGVLESFGLGTAVRSAVTPDTVSPRFLDEAPAPSQPSGRREFNLSELYRAQEQQWAKALSQDQYKASPFYRESVPWEEGMTRERAGALAEQADRKAVRDFYAAKRPITAFIGNLAGQAIDPINYIPIFGEAVAVANAARFGRVAGRALTASADAMANTALFGLLTAPTRKQLGDDVSWQTTVSQIAMAGLIGAGFGAIHGRFGRATPDELRADAESKLATLENVQKARVALNDAVDGLIHDGEVRLSPASKAYVDQAVDEIVAYHGSPHEFTAFDIRKIGAGEGTQAYGHGLYFAENPNVAGNYRLLGTRAADMPPDVRKAIDVLDRLGFDSRGGAINAIEANSDWMTRWDVNVENPGEKQAAETIQKWVDENPRGHLYEVRIAANKDHFIDFDKPVNEQNDFVRGAISKVWDKPPERIGGNVTPDKAAALRALGVPGIRYFDKGSRAEGKGTANYVVFSDKDARIVSKNGQAIEPPHSPISEFEAYHGTLAEFARFDPKYLGAETDADSSRSGFFFTSDARVAEGYAAADNPYKEGFIAKLMPGKMGDLYQAFNERLLRFFAGKGLVREGQILRTRIRFENPKIIESMAGKEFDESAVAEAIEAAKAAGHDGVIFKNARDPGYTDQSDIPSDIYVAFDPDKIEILSRHKDAASAAEARRAVGQTASPARNVHVDAASPRAEPANEGVTQAAARVGKPEATREVAEQYRVDPETGDFAELDDIEALRQSGRLTEEDEAALAEAEDTMKQATGYGEALKAFARCVDG